MRAGTIFLCGCGAETAMQGDVRVVKQGAVAFDGFAGLVMASMCPLRLVILRGRSAERKIAERMLPSRGERGWSRMAYDVAPNVSEKDCAGRGQAYFVPAYMAAVRSGPALGIGHLRTVPLVGAQAYAGAGLCCWGPVPRIWHGVLRKQPQLHDCSCFCISGRRGASSGNRRRRHWAVLRGFRLIPWDAIPGSGLHGFLKALRREGPRPSFRRGSPHRSSGRCFST